jgi:hypothetical protein
LYGVDAYGGYQNGGEDSPTLERTAGVGRDQRLDPGAMGHVDNGSQASLADEQDYSRRILRCVLSPSSPLLLVLPY